MTDTAWATEPVVVDDRAAVVLGSALKYKTGRSATWIGPFVIQPRHSPFCGRVEERDTLGGVEDGIDHQKVQVALIQGESGVGKRFCRVDWASSP